MTARPLFYILLFAALVGAVGFLVLREGSRAAELERLRQTTAQQTQDITQLKAQAEDLDAMMTEKIRTEVTRRIGRAQVNAAVQEAAREEPVVRDYLDQPVPASVRNAYRRTVRDAAADGTDGTDPRGGAARQPAGVDGGRAVRER